MDDKQNDKRKSERKRTLLGAVIEYAGTSTMNCVIRNLSQGGARLELDGAPFVPHAMMLSIPQRGIRRSASVVWQTREAAGIQFAE